MADEVEIEIVDADGIPEPTATVRAPRAPNPAMRRMGVLAICGVLVFALGFAAGRNTGSGGPAAASVPPAAATGVTPATAGDPSSSPATRGAGAPAGTAPAGTAPAGTALAGTALAGTALAGTATGAATWGDEPAGHTVCQGIFPPATIGTTSRLPADVPPVRLVVGARAALVDTSLPQQVRPLLPSDSPLVEAQASFVAQLVSVGHQVLALSVSCDGLLASVTDISASQRVWILTDGEKTVGSGTVPLTSGEVPPVLAGAAGGEAVVLSNPASFTLSGQRLGGVIGGTSESAYLVVYQDAATDPGGASPRLIPVHGGVSIASPAGFIPLSTIGDQIVGIVPAPAGPDGAGGYVLQVLDPLTGEAPSQPLLPMAHVIAAGETVTWQPVGCADDCELHRFDLATGSDRVIGSLPDLSKVLHGVTIDAGAGVDPGGWVAVSPDGSRLAILLPTDPDAPSGAVTHGHTFGAPSYSLAVVDTTSGGTAELPGLDLPIPQIAAVFSPDSRWLYVAAPTGSGSRVIAYDVAGPAAVAGEVPLVAGPYRVASVPGAEPGLGWVPLALLPTP